MKISFTVPLFTQVYKGLTVNCMDNLIGSVPHDKETGKSSSCVPHSQLLETFNYVTIDCGCVTC